MRMLGAIRHVMPDLSRRSNETEWLDDTDVDPAELERVLRDLARFNGTMLGHRLIISWLRRAVDHVPSGGTLTLVDVGCGYGDLLRAIRRWARRRGIPLKLYGLDLSEETVRIARAATDEADRIDYQVGDIFDFRSTAGIDFVASSLLTHHLSDQLIIKFLGCMEGTARKGWLIYTSSATSYPIISWASLAPCCACIRWSSMMAASQLPVRSRVASGEHG